jgi:hypothetical protein
VVTRHADLLLLRVEREEDLQSVVDAARAAGSRLQSVVPHKASLEELFLSHIPGGPR